MEAAKVLWHETKPTHKILKQVGNKMSQLICQVELKTYLFQLTNSFGPF